MGDVRGREKKQREGEVVEEEEREEEVVEEEKEGDVGEKDLCGEFI